MQHLKLSFLFLSLLSVVGLSAQDGKNFLGEWESNDSDGYGKYSIFEYDGKIHAVLYYWKDNKEEFSLEKELAKISDEEWEQESKLSDEEQFKSLEELLVLRDFVKKENKWEGKIIYDEDGSTVDGSLKLIDKDQLEVAYSYWGFSDKSIWKRIN